MKEVKMKTKIIIKLCIMFLVCIWIADASAEQDYPMVCKGGGNMWGEFSLYWGNIIVIYFDKSPQAASQQEPAPGTCAWLDRPISPQEPAKLVPSGRCSDTPKSVTLRYQNITIPLDVNRCPDPTLRYLMDAVYNGKLFYVRCYNKEDHGQHWFEITHVGP
jgi:hypothetical protein